MYLRQAPASRLSVQAVHVLGDGVLEQPHCFQVCQRVVARIGLRLLYGLAKLDAFRLFLAVPQAQGPFPPGLGVCDEGVVAAGVWLTDARPQAARASIGGYAALRAHAGAGEGYQVVRCAQYLGGALKGLPVFRGEVHGGYPITWSRDEWGRVGQPSF